MTFYSSGREHCLVKIFSKLAKISRSSFDNWFVFTALRRVKKSIALSVLFGELRCSWIVDDQAQCGNDVFFASSTRHKAAMCRVLPFFVHIYCCNGVCRAKRFEARIQQMLWKINFSDIVFFNSVCCTC